MRVRSAAESFHGSMTRLDIWSRVLTTEEISDLKHQCEPYFGDLLAWPDVHNGLKGHIKVLYKKNKHAILTLFYADFES